MKPYNFEKSVDIDVTFRYSEPYLPTPRCRKYRYRPAKDTTTYSIPLFQRKDAVLAFRRIEGFCEHEHIKEYYAYGGYLWTRRKGYCSGEMSWATREDMEKHIQYKFTESIHDPKTYAIVSDHDECVAAIQNTQMGALMETEDGEFWAMEEVGEPVYVVMTFGMGHNHDSTALSVQESYNSNIPYTRYFNALQKDEAVAEAKRIALARGDTNSIPRIPSRWDNIEVLAPELVKRNPAADYGGAGDKFTNRLEAMFEKSNSVAESTAMTVAVLGAVVAGKI